MPLTGLHHSFFNTFERLKDLHKYVRLYFLLMNSVDLMNWNRSDEDFGWWWWWWWGINTRYVECKPNMFSCASSSSSMHASLIIHHHHHQCSIIDVNGGNAAAAAHLIIVYSFKVPGRSGGGGGGWLNMYPTVGWQVAWLGPVETKMESICFICWFKGRRRRRRRRRGRVSSICAHIMCIHSN